MALAIIGLIVFAFIIIVAAVLLDLPVPGMGGGSSNLQSNIRNIVATQREAQDGLGQPKKKDASALAAEARVERKTSSKLTLEKRIKYAGWDFPPFVLVACEISFSIVFFLLVRLKFFVPLQILALASGPMLGGWVLNSTVDRRFKAFDSDFPNFLMSLVGLLKTGMNPTNALKSAAMGLDEGSSVRVEVELMLERMRLGLSEDQSIGSFAEDVFHPDVELFVQALLLSKRVGGNLSDTLERLAGQVRKRQYFRQSAQAAVSMQRMSIWVIIFVLVGVEGYMLVMTPDLVLDGIRDPFGFQVWQLGVFVILIGMIWIRQITKIKV